MARIYFFGKLADVTGQLCEDLSLPQEIGDTETLRAWLDTERGFDGGLLHRSVRIAVNGEVRPDPSPVVDTDEIAFMPPVGGG